MRRMVLNVLIVTALLSTLTQAQPRQATLSAQVAATWRVIPDLSYSARHHRARLDLYLPVQRQYRALVVMFHGGGARKEQVALSVLPFLAANMAVANVEYRMLEDAAAPAAVYDAVCVTRWLVHEAPEDYRVAERDLVLTGNSAGGHLALMAGLANERFGQECAHLKPVRPRAVVNLFGVSDFERFLFEPPASSGIQWAKRWLRADRQLARAMSPVHYVTRNSPPVLSVHGTKDRWVPIEQSERLHQKLSDAEVPNRLVGVANGEHGGYWTAWIGGQLSDAERAIYSFLDEQLLR